MTRDAHPAEQYLRLIWAARRLYIAIVLAFFAGAVILTLVLPKRYRADAILSIRHGLSLESASMLYDGVLAAGPGSPRPPINPALLSQRLLANRTVTMAARDAGVIGPNDTLDDRQIASWVEVDPIKDTDLVTVSIEQPTSEGAQRFSEHLVARTLAFHREEATSTAREARTLMSKALTDAEAALRQAEQRLLAANASGAAPDKQIRVEGAANELKLGRETYTALRRRLTALELLTIEQLPSVQVVDPPSRPTRPSFPRPVLMLSTGLVLGILIATLVVVLRAVFSNEEPSAGDRSRREAVFEPELTLPR
jgi:uncharacterized protein involved in exopolysaccharide biosynthesis